MSDKAKIRRRLRCPQCGSLDNIKRNNVPNGPGGDVGHGNTPFGVRTTKNSARGHENGSAVSGCLDGESF